MKRGAKILRKKKSQMFGIEYPFLFGFVFLLVIIALVGSEEWNSSFRTDRVSANARILAAASDEVYSAGPGSVKCVTINNPKGLVSGGVVGNEIIFVLRAKGQENEIAYTTKAYGAGVFQITEGQTKLCFSMIKSDLGQGGGSTVIGESGGSTPASGDGCQALSGDPDCSDSNPGSNGGFDYGSNGGSCGDGFTGGSENCEVGTACDPGYRCNENCQCEVGASNVCGDGIIDSGEQCDGNSLTYCSASIAGYPPICCPPPYQSTCVYAIPYCLACACQYDYPDLSCPSGRVPWVPPGIAVPPALREPRDPPPPPPSPSVPCGGIPWTNNPAACNKGACPPDMACKAVQTSCTCVATTCGDETYTLASETCDQSGGEGNTGCPAMSSCSTSCASCESPDSDGDGLSDSIEAEYGTNDMIWDTDGDGVSDGFENYYSMNPLVQDTDSDTVSDYDDSDPYNDNDNDGDEIPNSRDPGPLDSNNP